ncbi:insulin-like growth factor-binding protein complex acid labile subunit [Asterias rubens]|uniref:insulin-like growth factor-binding protein complex acid labile subunit n=1 Tax=Asterias rubens TaxID=7604 RepID=UPI001455D356|nr:insulin-like growth factor-binding protein complex acid labile subunit [Asterias rubens]XP_033627126.1 insulin-like growth factor-binding protein complex acid labile subunit [Asterias rubens]
MGSTEWTLFMCCLGACICISQSSTCSHAQCVYDYVTARADCSSLNLDCIPVNYPDALIMDLSHNNISELSPDDFNGTFSRLAELYLDHNNISDLTSLLESNELESLQILSVKHNVISYLDSYNACRLSSLTELSVDYNSITYMYISTRSSFRKVQRFSADFNLIRNANVYLYKLSNIVISLQYNRLTEVNGHSSYGKNASLLLDHNEIRHLHFSTDNNHMDTISLNHNQLLSVDLNIGATDTFNIGSNGLANWDGIYIGDYYAMKRLDMSNNSFDSLIQPPWAEALELLNADTNLLANLSSTTLSGFVDLTELHVANNRLLFISPTALSQLSMLQSLYLDDNDLTSLFGGVFSNQSYLIELSITTNRLTMLHPDYFLGLVSLERLYLAGNQLTSVNAQMFQMVPEILTLDLSQNELQLVDLHDCALHLTNLQHLSLAHNKIHDTNTILGFYDNLQILDMSYNLIQVVPGDSLSGRNRAVSQLELEGNPLQCDCRLTGLRDWLRTNQPHVEPRCEGPNHNYGSVISDLEIYDLSCQPPMAMVDINQLTALDGQSVTLKCTATGIPAPTVTWLSPNDTEIAHDWQGRFTILQGKILHIIPVEKHDQGRYTCLVQNILGEKSRAVVNLTVTNSTKSDSPQPQPQPNSLDDFCVLLTIINIIMVAVYFVSPSVSQ